MDSIKVNLEKYALPRSLLIIPTTMLLLMQTIQSGDIEQILPATSNFTIDGDNSAEVMRVQSDGNVGIGTTTPNERLEVNGHIRMTDGNEATDTVMVGNADGTASWADIATIKDGNGTDDQSLSLIGNILTLENGGTVDLSSFIDNTDDQNITDLSLSGNTLSITLENGNTQTINLSSLNNSAAVTAVQSNIDAHVADDNDTSSTNELLSNAVLTGTDLVITEAGIDTTVDLSALDNNGTDNQDIQDLALDASNILTVGIEDGTSDTVDLSALNNSAAVTAVQSNIDAHVADDNDTSSTNELLSNAVLTGTDLVITEAGIDTTVDLSALDNNGTDNQDIQDLALDASNILTVGIEDGTSDTVDLSALNDTAAIATVATALTAHVADDNDTSDTNEIQTLTSDNNSVTLVQTGNDYDLSVSIPAQTVTTLTQQASPNHLDYKYTSENATETTLKSSPIVAFGKVSGAGTLQRGYGATVSRNSTGNYTVTLNTARSTTNYTIQLSILDSNGAGRDDYDVVYSAQSSGSFVVEIGDNDNGNTDRQPVDFEFMFTVIDY